MSGTLFFKKLKNRIILDIQESTRDRIEFLSLLQSCPTMACAVSVSTEKHTLTHFCYINIVCVDSMSPPLH